MSVYLKRRRGRCPHHRIALTRHPCCVSTCQRCNTERKRAHRARLTEVEREAVRKKDRERKRRA